MRAGRRAGRGVGERISLSGRVISSAPVDDPSAAARPERRAITGKTVRLEPIDSQRHGEDLFAASHLEADPAELWRYMGYLPSPDLPAFESWLTTATVSDDPLYFAVVDRAENRARGMTSFLRIEPDHRAIEIGAIWFGPKLQKTRQATEALFCMMGAAFDELGYRRLEWKCDAANQPSRQAALRLGFVFEGVFYRHMIVKGRNRDTAWYSLTEEEWPAVRERIERWLTPDNFDNSGRQRRSLSAF